MKCCFLLALCVLAVFAHAAPCHLASQPYSRNECVLPSDRGLCRCEEGHTVAGQCNITNGQPGTCGAAGYTLCCEIYEIVDSVVDSVDHKWNQLWYSMPRWPSPCDDGVNSTHRTHQCDQNSAPQPVAHTLPANIPSTVTASVVVPTQQIAPGVSMPVISMGTWSEGTKENSTLITGNWLSLGGRGIDSAFGYFDQKKIAATIQASGVPREHLFITSKLPGCVAAERVVEADLKELNTTYIDLMLIHFPIPSFNCPNTWKVLEDYVRQGKLKAIGVSNFKSEDLDRVLSKATIVPAVNQISHSVLEHDDELVQYCAQKNITIEAYSPLGSPGRHKANSTSVFNNPTISAIAQAHNVSNPQVALRWIVQSGHVLTVLSESAAHQANDADVFTFQLSADEMTQLDGIQKSE